MKAFIVIVGCLTVCWVIALISLWVAVRPQIDAVKDAQARRFQMFYDLGITKNAQLQEAIQKDPTLGTKLKAEIDRWKQISADFYLGWRATPLYRVWEAVAFVLTFHRPEQVSAVHQFLPGIIETFLLGGLFGVLLLIPYLTKPEIRRQQVADDVEE